MCFVIGAMSDRIDDIRKGFMILLPELDEKGQAIIYVNPALFDEKVEEVRIRTTIHSCAYISMQTLNRLLICINLGTSSFLVFSSCYHGNHKESPRLNFFNL